VRLAEFSFPALIKDLLQQGHSLRCRTLGTSMFPLIRSGNIIQVEPVKVQDLRVGDVVVYHDCADSLVAHRLIEKSLVRGRVVLTTKGDTFPRSGAEKVQPEQILGRVVAVEWGKRLKIRLGSAPGKFIGILLARFSPHIPWGSALVLVKNHLTSLCKKSIIKGRSGPV